MRIDYDAIGIRIRVARVRAKLSQLRLAELSGLSVAHISNIETGNTKLSLPSIVSIANALQVSVDSLLCDNIVQAVPIFVAEAHAILSDCCRRDICFLITVLKAVKTALQRY